jgi:hypothetical protein
MRRVAVSTLRTNVAYLAGVNTLITEEQNAINRSVNRFGRLAWERAAWPFASILSQIIPDLRVRSVDVGSGGASYSSAPSVSFSGGGGSSAAATATVNSDQEVNGVSVTNNGTGFTGTPTVAFSGGGGSGATATANMLSYIDFNQDIAEVFRVTDKDPYGGASFSDIAFRNIFVSGATEFGEAIMPNRASTAPVWVHYRKPYPEYASGASDFPFVFSEYVVMGSFGDWLQADGQNSKAQVAYQQAEAILQTELDKLERQEGQTQPIQFTTYGTTIATPA